MPSSELASRVLRATSVFESRGITQSKIASRLGASQSQVSRVLAGRSVKRSKLAEEICLYAETLETGVSLRAVIQNAEVLEAVRHAWDGSAARARALSTVIRSLAVLVRPAIQDER
jgi:transcriptional regulator with XRE-family HTH domain